MKYRNMLIYFALRFCIYREPITAGSPGKIEAFMARPETCNDFH